MGTYEMQTSNEAAVPILLKEDVMQLLTTTLDHCYIINGEECRRQIRGIPMGISPSPQLANLYCYVVGREFGMRTPSSSSHSSLVSIAFLCCSSTTAALRAVTNSVD